MTDPDEPRTPSVDVAALRAHTRTIAAQAGYYATPAPGQRGALTGTDLGWAVAHRDKLWVMYGDSWWIDPFNLASAPDDALGQISLDDFPDGASVDAFVEAHPAPEGQPAWRAAAPTMSVMLRGGTGPGFAPVIFERDGQTLPSGVGCVPITAFSNGRQDAGEGVFAIFSSSEHVPCDDAGGCQHGFVCDPGLGTSKNEMLHPPCVVGETPGCIEGPGYCQDQGSSIYDPSSVGGRTHATVVRHDIAVTTPDSPTSFKTQPWETQRFLNSTSRTVSDFDAARIDGMGNDYTPAQGNALPRSGVFVWGRPYFGGIGSQGRDAQLYLLWAPMPTRDVESNFDWEPRFYTGLDDLGRPEFSEREVDALALDLDAETPGYQPEEVHDVVAQMAISWVPSLDHFVMFYGGDAPSWAEALVARSDSGAGERDPLGRVFMRFAEHPWGPWTRPRELFAAGDRNTDAQPSEQYAPGGILAHNNCRDADCARYDPAYLFDIGGNNNGVFYGSSIIDAWTSAHEGETDLYWLLSTWNPYQVVLMKTTFAP